LKLTVKQTVALDYLGDNITKEVLFGGGAGGGKSALGCYWILKQCIKYSGSRWLIGRARLKTLKETTLMSFFEISKKQGISASIMSYNQQSGTVNFFNGSQILLKDLDYYPSDPNYDELGSLEITGAFIDESNQITKKAKQIVGSRIRYKLDEYNVLPKILMTCNPAKNWVYDEFYKPHRDGNILEYRAFVSSLVTDNVHISKHYIDNLKVLDEVSKQRLLYGNWDYDDSKDRLIEYDSIQDYFTNSHVQKTGKIYITSDIARKGKDKTTIRVWDGFVCFEVHELTHSLIDETANYIKNLSIKYNVPMSRVVVDEDGVGGGVRDILRCLGFVNNGRAIGNANYANLKTQCTCIVAQMIVNKEMYEYPTIYRDNITQEMESVKYTNIDKDGKVSILGKDKVKEIIGRSPDHWDSIMMRGYFTLLQRA
jgi:hypothetical protein